MPYQQSERLDILSASLDCTHFWKITPALNLSQYPRKMFLYFSGFFAFIFSAWAINVSSRFSRFSRYVVWM